MTAAWRSRSFATAWTCGAELPWRRHTNPPGVVDAWHGRPSRRVTEQVSLDLATGTVLHARAPVHGVRGYTPSASVIGVFADPSCCRAVGRCSKGLMAWRICG